MKKNKILTTAVTVLFFGIFWKAKPVEAVKINVYDPRTEQHYEIMVKDISQARAELAQATGLSKSLFLLDRSSLLKDNYDLELPIKQVVEKGVIYNIYRNQEVVVAGLSNQAVRNVVIKREINHQKVTRISSHAFKSTSIISVIFEPNSAIKKIEPFTFSQCHSLATIALPDSLTSIDRKAFEDCSSLIELSLPASLENIGYRAFFGCIPLREIHLGSNSQLQSLGKQVFDFTQIDEQKFRQQLGYLRLRNCQKARESKEDLNRARADAICNFQNAEKRRADQLVALVNLTNQKNKNELRNIYSLFDRHCFIDDLIFAYDALTRKVSTERGEDNPDLMKLKQRRACYCESLQRMERERALDLMKVSRLE